MHCKMGWKSMSEPRASRPGVSLEADDSPEMEDISIPELISFLRSSFQKTDFDKVERILRSREESMKEELTLKEVEKMELERELGVLRSRCTLLELEIKKCGEGSRVSTKEADRNFQQNSCERFEEEIASLKEDYKRAKERIARLLDNQEEDKDVKEKFVELMAEKRDLEGAKRRAENEIYEWRRKYEELEARVRKGEGCKMIIDISDSEDDMNAKACGLTMEHAMGTTFDVKKEATTEKSLKVTPFEFDQWNKDAVEDDDSSCEKNFLLIPTPKRKSVSRVVASDSEDEDDDEDRIPIGKLKMRRLGEVKEGRKETNANLEDVTPSRRRLVPLRECSGTKAGERGTSPSDSIAQNFSPTNADRMTSRKKTAVYRKLGYSDTEEDDIGGGEKVDDAGSESEGDSLGGFIVSGSDSTESESSSHDVLVEESHSDVDLANVLSKIRREKDNKRWEYEADMLASFSKDLELCMKAICALYRQQTSEEKSMKETLLVNKRGFSMFDAKRGSMMAEFLMDGDRHGPLKKSVKELKVRYPDGLDYCRKLATHYSKQLFMIYQNREDPFFLPS